MIPIQRNTLFTGIDRCCPSVLARQWHDPHAPGWTADLGSL